MHIGIIILSIIFIIEPIPFNSHPVKIPVQVDISYTIEQTPRINPIEKLDNMLIGKRILDKSI